MALLLAGFLAGCPSPGGRGSGAAAPPGLVFVRVDGGSTEIVRLRIDDAAEQAVTATPDRDETWPFWSPAAGRLVFQTSDAARDSDLILWAPEAGEEPLPRSPEREERWAAWAPGQARLVYAFRGGRPAGGLVLLDLASGSRKLVARSQGADVFFRPSWSPLGEKLVAQRRNVNGKGSQLWEIPIGAPPRPLTRDAGHFHLKPAYSRDGARIVFSRRPAAGGPHDVVSISAEGNDLRLLAHDPEADEHSARPSPTRDEIAFVSDRDGVPRTYLTALDGSGTRALSPPGLSAVAPRWSPDGELIAVTLSSTGALPLGNREALGQARVAVLDRSGRVLAEADGFMPDWMPAWP